MKGYPISLYSFSGGRKDAISERIRHHILRLIGWQAKLCGDISVPHRGKTEFWIYEGPGLRARYVEDSRGVQLDVWADDMQLCRQAGFAPVRQSALSAERSELVRAMGLDATLL